MVVSLKICREYREESKLPPALARLMAGQWKTGAIPQKWDGKAAERIVEQLERILGKN
ncbi:MAG: hypothetical protein AAB433_15045 [Nitrospirota bacterium]